MSLTIQWFVFLFSVNMAPMTFSSLEPLLALETAWHPSRPFLRQFGTPDVFFPLASACTWNCMAHLSSFSPSIWRPWRSLPWSPCLHLKLHGAPLVLFSVNLAPLTFSSPEPLLALETAWRPSHPFLRQFGAPDVFSLEPLLALETAWRSSLPFLRQFSAPDVFFPVAPACTWNCMAPLSSFSPSIWRPWCFLPWNPRLHLKLHGAPFVLFSVNLAPLTFSSLEPLLALETAWSPSLPFLRQFGAPDVFFPGAPACTWNCMAPLSSFSPSIWRSWCFLPWSPCLHLKLHGAPLFLFSVNLALLTFSSLEPLLALESAWHPSRPFLRQFGAPWRFLPWSPCLHLKLHGAPFVLFSVNLAPLTFSSLEPLLALETAWRPFLPFLRQFSAPDVFFPGAPACTWNCMGPLSSFSPSIWRPWRSSPGAPVCTWKCMAPLSSYYLTFFLSLFLLAPSFVPFFLSYSLLFLFFLFSPSLFLSLSFSFFLFGAPLVTPGGPGPQSPPQDTPLYDVRSQKLCTSMYILGMKERLIKVVLW